MNLFIIEKEYYPYGPLRNISKSITVFWKQTSVLSIFVFLTVYMSLNLDKIRQSNKEHEYITSYFKYDQPTFYI